MKLINWQALWGSFGYPEGSKLARSAEHLLIKDRSFTAEEIIRFSELVTGLQQELAKTPITSTAVPVSTISIFNYRVLVVDDDAALTERLKVESEAWGLRMKIAPNITDARSRLALVNTRCDITRFKLCRDRGRWIDASARTERAIA